ncbi:MAG: SAM-dependent methyltransferase, partial [Gammaproteobacteria bacterium]
MQNTSHAVMAQRLEPKDSFDDFPTPPWATRAL